MAHFYLEVANHESDAHQSAMTTGLDHPHYDVIQLRGFGTLSQSPRLWPSPDCMGTGCGFQLYTNRLDIRSQ